MSTQIIRGNALDLPLADASVDLIVTSPPYFGLRSYQDGGEHYAGQIGDEPTPAEFVDALLAATAEMVRVLKPSGSIWVNLGDKYAGSGVMSPNLPPNAGPKDAARLFAPKAVRSGVPTKSLIGIPWRYALRCIDDIGLILRAEVIWSKPNGLPESVTDRVRRSHETWFHFTKEPRYFSAVDEIREQAEQGRPQAARAAQLAARHGIGEEHRQALLARGLGDQGRSAATQSGTGKNTAEVLRLAAEADAALGSYTREFTMTSQSLGKLPGSVWTIPTEPLHVPDHLGIDHFAAFPTEWPRRIVQGWSPSGICTECGEGRRPTRDGAWHFADQGHEVSRRALRQAEAAGVTAEIVATEYGLKARAGGNHSDGSNNVHPTVKRLAADFRITTLAATTAVNAAQRGIGGEACACPEPTAPTRPAVVLDPFGGTGTTALVAHALGRHGISNDMSADYCRLAGWRTSDPKQIAKAARREYKPPAEKIDGQLDLLEGIA